MTAPTLIVGLGGVGSRIIAQVEALATEEQRKSLSFVSFDTDVNDLRALKQKGYGGRFVQTSSKLTVGEYLELDKQSRDSWFPVNNILCRKAVSEGAGQVRAISRLAFMSSIREGRMTELHEAIDSLYKLSGETTVQALRVIIVSTLAGGTGSGLLLPVALYLRDYLMTNYQLSASIVRGFFILPEVLYKVIPTESERNNLRCNAYATLRELDAFLMKGDGRLPEPYRSNLKFELPAVGSSGLRNVDVMPYDFCFLFDGQNMDGGTLNTYEDYLSHAANCIFAQSIGPTSAKSNSSEDNVVLALVAEAGRNRYCGAGSAVLEYPYEDVRDYIAFNWAREKMGKQWLAADAAFKEKMQEAKEKQLKGMSVKDINRGEEYVTHIVNYAKSDAFSDMVERSCMLYDETGLEARGNKWDKYVQALEEFCSRHSLHMNPTIVGRSSNIMSKIQNDKLTDRKDPHKIDYDKVKDLKREIKAYYASSKTILQNATPGAASAIFNGAKDIMDFYNESKDAFYLENALKSGESNAMHPNAIRYFLYKLEAALVSKVAEFDRACADTQWEDTEAESGADGKKNTKKDKRLSQKKLEKEIRKQRGELESLMENIDSDYGFRQSFVKLQVFTFAKDYVQKLSKKFEVFYDNLEENIKQLDYTIGVLRQKYDLKNGKAIRYVCANEKCLNHFEERLTSPAGLMELPEGFSNRIYSAIRAAMIEEGSFEKRNTEQKEWHKGIFNDIILKFWRDTVTTNCSTYIDMDVINAIRKEAEILENEERKAAKDYRETYLLDLAKEARKLAMPFISVEQGLQQHINEACTYNEILKKQIRVEDKDKVLPNGIPVKDDQLSKYKLLYYKAIYGKRANQIPKFAPERDSETAPKDKGEYFRAYFDRIQRIDPNVCCSKVITPHIDKRWHIVTELPDLDEHNQKRQQKDIFMSMYYAFLYNFIQYEGYGNAKYKYVYKKEMGAFSGAEEALNGSNTAEFIVSNNTPCDQFYEVLEALTINPIIVGDILHRVEKLRKKETDSRKPFGESAFAKALEELKIRSVPGDRVRSLFELPVLYRMSSPVDEYNPESAELLISAAMLFIRDNVLWYIDKDNADLYLSRVIWEQYLRFEESMKAFAEGEDEVYRGSAIDPFTNNVRTVIRNFFNQQAETEKENVVKNHMEH